MATLAFQLSTPGATAAGLHATRALHHGLPPSTIGLIAELVLALIAIVGVVLIGRRFFASFRDE